MDLAAQGGGNCELTKLNEIVTTPNGVTIIGYADMPARSAVIWGDWSKAGCGEWWLIGNIHLGQGFAYVSDKMAQEEPTKAKDYIPSTSTIIYLALPLKVQHTRLLIQT